jgi:hypothetical protein
MTRKDFHDAMSVLTSADRQRVNNLCAERINTVWQERGYYGVHARVEVRAVYNGKVHVPMPVVVSETLNGLPKQP